MNCRTNSPWEITLDWQSDITGLTDRLTELIFGRRLLLGCSKTGYVDRDVTPDHRYSKVQALGLLDVRQDSHLLMRPGHSGSANITLVTIRDTLFEIDGIYLQETDCRQT